MSVKPTHRTVLSRCPWCEVPEPDTIVLPSGLIATI